MYDYCMWMREHKQVAGRIFLIRASEPRPARALFVVLWRAKDGYPALLRAHIELIEGFIMHVLH